MTNRKRYKALNDMPDQEGYKHMTKINTYADILDLWKEFYQNALKSEDERRMMKNLLKQEICDDCDKDRTYDEELARMNRLAKALKGNLDK